MELKYFVTLKKWYIILMTSSNIMIRKIVFIVRVLIYKMDENRNCK